MQANWSGGAAAWQESEKGEAAICDKSIRTRAARSKEDKPSLDLWRRAAYRRSGFSVSCFASGLKGQLVLMKISPSVKKALQGFAIIQSLHSGVDWKYGGLSFTMFVNSRASHWQVPFASMLKPLAYTRTVIFTLYLKMSELRLGRS